MLARVLRSHLPRTRGAGGWVAASALGLAACVLPAATKGDRVTTTSSTSSGGGGAGPSSGGGGGAGDDACPNSKQVIIDADRDATLDSLNPATPMGASMSLVVADGVGAVQRGLVHFDLSAVPSSATICLGGLQLHIESCNPATTPLKVHALTSPWLESSATWLQGEPGVAWAGGAFGATPTASYTVLACSAPTEIGVEVTADVAAFVAGTQPNYGWLLKDAPESSGGQFVAFGSRESSTPPKLNVIYSQP